MNPFLKKYTESGRLNENWFKNNPKKTIMGLLTIMCIIFLVVAEFSFRYVVGLGDPVLYDSHPFYGYRPFPNQNVYRYNRTRIQINNLGLRASQDWDEKVDNKILFLGDSITYGGEKETNEQLFSYLAAKELIGFQSGNAGVGGWGVENIYGLIVETSFLPAHIYVTVLIENDFYRGLIRLPHIFGFGYKPRLALEEWIAFLIYKLNMKRYDYDDRYLLEENEWTQVVEKSVKKLKAIDRYISSHGFKHLIFISPTRSQALGKAKINEQVKNILKKHEVKSHYILREVKALSINENQINLLYRDKWHLSIEGHKLWGEIIGKHLQEIVPNGRV